MELDITRPETTYRQYIEREFRRRCRRNSLYSLRAFARDLDISASKLSEVLRGKCGLSNHAAELLCAHLKLSEVETQHFLIMVEAEHSRNSFRKEQAKEVLKSFQAIHGYSELDLERFKIISDWQHLALLELMELDGFESNPEWMADRLDLDIFLVSESLERLLNFELIEIVDGKYRQTGANHSITTDVPSREIREYHLQMMAKATESVDQGDRNERDVSHMIFAMDAQDYPKALEALKKFRREFATNMQQGENKNELYSLGIQLIPVTSKKGNV
ncbi:DUF4423 domain-containing protein [Bdellovibrio sp. HCB274]|uniref:DUF4423 domain-containing protein n=1 Tax=Bdellovibrio sp. HCB274 TaxID=3394361 RepID=UPI0039B6C094